MDGRMTYIPLLVDVPAHHDDFFRAEEGFGVGGCCDGEVCEGSDGDDGD
jgi:hypothetical protein